MWLELTNVVKSEKVLINSHNLVQIQKLKGHSRLWVVGDNNDYYIDIKESWDWLNRVLNAIKEVK